MKNVQSQQGKNGKNFLIALFVATVFSLACWYALFVFVKFLLK